MTWGSWSRHLLSVCTVPGSSAGPTAVTAEDSPEGGRRRAAGALNDSLYAKFKKRQQEATEASHGERPAGGMQVMARFPFFIGALVSPVCVFATSY